MFFRRDGVSFLNILTYCGGSESCLSLFSLSVTCYTNFRFAAVVSPRVILFQLFGRDYTCNFHRIQRRMIFAKIFIRSKPIFFQRNQFHTAERLNISELLGTLCSILMNVSIWIGFFMKITLISMLMFWLCRNVRCWAKLPTIYFNKLYRNDTSAQFAELKKQLQSLRFALLRIHSFR